MPASLFATTVISICLLLFLASCCFVIIKKRYSWIALTFMIYHILFFLSPGLLHTLQNTFPFYALSYSENVQEAAALALLAFTCFFLFGFFLFNPRTQIKPEGSGMNVYFVSRQRASMTLYALVASQLVAILFIGIETFLVRRSELDLSVISNEQATVNIVIGLTRSVSFLALFFSIFWFRDLRWQHRIVCTLSSAACFLIINYPLALARFALFAYILTFVFIYVSPTPRAKLGLFVAFCLGITTIFPLASHVSRGEEGHTYNNKALEYFRTSGDFDGYQSHLNVVSYVADKGVSFGNQLLGVAAIAVPRSAWPLKPEPTGTTAAKHIGYPYTNISAPIISELYVDFGAVGVTLGALLLGLLLRHVDARLGLFNVRRKSPTTIIPAMIAAYVIILCRGSLMAVIANIMLQLLLTAWILWFTTKHASSKANLVECQTDRN